jgi:post-segregation antitoxin (ccd killing protein)
MAREIPTKLLPPPRPTKQATKQWLDENREAIDEYNLLVAARGVFSDGRRRF